MTLSRRNFIKSSSILLGAILYPGKKLLSFKNILSVSGIEEIRPNIGVFTSQGGTIGWYITDDAVVVIDSQFADSAKNFMNEIKPKLNRKIDVLFNTHHHSDHTSGNFYLKDFANQIVAQENCPKLQKQFYGSGEFKDEQVYANITFSDEWEIDLGNEKLNAYYFGSAHTAGDAFIHFQNVNVVHLGDLVFNKIYPYMDRPAGCSIEGLIKVLGKVVNMFDSDTKFIYGHANSDEFVTGSIEDLKVMQNYFSALTEFVQKEINNGKSLAEIKNATHIPGFKNLIEKWNGAKDMSLTAAYEELTGK